MRRGTVIWTVTQVVMCYDVNDSSSIALKLTLNAATEGHAHACRGVTSHAATVCNFSSFSSAIVICMCCGLTWRHEKLFDSKDLCYWVRTPRFDGELWSAWNFSSSSNLSTRLNSKKTCSFDGNLWLAWSHCQWAAWFAKWCILFEPRDRGSLRSRRSDTSRLR